MLSQFFILSPRGDTIILRDYLKIIPKVCIACPHSLHCALAAVFSDERTTV